MKLHVAILPSSGLGHVIPHLELAKRLVTFHNCHVSFFVLNTEASTSTIKTQLLRSTTIPDGLDIVDLPQVNISNLVKEDTQVQTRISIIIRESLPNIESVIVKSARPTILVADFFATDAFDIADKLSIPKYIFFTSSASALAFMMYLPTLDREIDGEFVDLEEPIQVPGCYPIRVDDLVDPVRNRKNEAYKWFLHHASRFPMADGILVNTYEDFEPKSLKALNEDPILRQIPTPRVHPVGPILRSDKQELVKSESYLMTWLDMQPCDSVLFVSFGSGGTMSLNQVTELAFGLELSQQRFIWVVRRPEEAKSSGTFFNVGSEDNDPSDYLPDGFLSRIKGVGLVVPTWSPQTDILSHVSTGGFLSHCGWNSTLESIVHGVPMVAWPLFAEQKMNSVMVTEELGVAVRVKVDREKGVVGREEIERVVRLVMEGEEGKGLRERIKEFKESGLRTLAEAESFNNSLSHVVEEWKCSVED